MDYLITSGVYSITNTINGNQYIGSSYNILNRWRMHRSDLRKKRHHSEHLQRAWDKYSESAFIFEIIEEVQPDQCIVCEQYWIDLLKPVYNASPTAGSARGVKRSEGTRAKLRALAIGRPSGMKGRHLSEEARRKLSEGRKGNTWSKGKLKSAETRAKISITKTGVPRSKAYPTIKRTYPYKPRPTQSERQRGVKHSPERIEKNRLSHLGKPSGRKGQIHTEETKAKMRATKARNRAERQIEQGPTLWDAS